MQEVVFLGLPDSRMSADGDASTRIGQEIRDFKPDTILAFDPEYPFRVEHRDHIAAGAATLIGAHAAGFRGRLLLFSTSAPNTAVDMTKHWNDVEELLAMHKSQFFGEKLERIRSSVKAYKIDAGGEFGPALADSFRACRLK